MLQCACANVHIAVLEHTKGCIARQRCSPFSRQLGQADYSRVLCVGLLHSTSKPYKCKSPSQWLAKLYVCLSNLQVPALPWCTLGSLYPMNISIGLLLSLPSARDGNTLAIDCIVRYNFACGLYNCLWAA